MRVGHLYIIKENRHSYQQLGDIVICLRTNGSWLFTGYNIKSMVTHHYHNEHVEVLCK
jgi:hypothetical protein